MLLANLQAADERKEIKVSAHEKQTAAGRR